MGGGAHLRVDLSQPKDGQGLREVVRHRGGLCLRGDDAADGEALGSCLRVSHSYYDQLVNTVPATVAETSCSMEGGSRGALLL